MRRRGVLGLPLAALAGAAAERAAASPAPPSSPVPAVAPAAPGATATPSTGTGAGAAAVPWVHAIAAFGAPKYPRGFAHFEYVDPAAPKGGTLHLANPDRRTSFDKFNPFTVRGQAPAGLEIFMLETLCTTSADEPMTMYGLLAEEMQVAPDKSSITFRLHPRACFSNGDPVTAADVQHSHAMLTSPQAQPLFQGTYGDGIGRPVVVDDRTIRFDLTTRTTETLFKLGSLYVFSRRWGLKPDGTRTRFDELLSDVPLLSGPYTVARHASGRQIEFARNPAYWARDLGVARGTFNFDRVVYRYYQDDTVSTEAFKAGEYDLVKVYSARIWARQHVGPKWDDGRIVKTELPSRNGIGLQAFELNLRRPIFQDIRVREALCLSYDFETANRYHHFKRANSVFNNSEFAAEGTPSGGELALLEPYRASLPPRVFGPAYVAPRNDTDPNALRRNLLRARALLEEAGWKLDGDGVLRDRNGAAFVFENLSAGAQDSASQLNPWRRNLDKLGIRLTDRAVDFALFNQRLTEFEFDIVTIVEPSFTLPLTTNYVDLYGSKAAGEKGSGNYRGVRSAAADHVLAAMAAATTLDAFRDACRALDRIVMWSFWQVPQLYGDTEDYSCWNKFGMPKMPPKYFQINASPTVSPLLAWPLVTWWMRDAAARS